MTFQEKSHDFSDMSHDISYQSHDCRLTISACQDKEVRLVWCLLWANPLWEPVDICSICLLGKLDHLEQRSTDHSCLQ